MGAVLAHDVGKVAPGVVDPVAVKVHLVGEQLAVQRAKGAEGVGGEQHAVGGVERDHGLGPVDHGGLHESNRVVAEGVGVTLLNFDELVAVDVEAELAHDHEGLGGGDDLHIGPADEDLLN